MSTAGRALEGVAHDFIDAFNRRDAEGLVAVADPSIEWHPTSLVGGRRTYYGHDGLRQWVTDLDSSQVKHQARVREVRVVDQSQFVVLSEVVVGGEVICPSAMVARVADQGLIVEARGYLTDAQMLTRLGLVPEHSVSHS
jgi:SnoaL-like protein